MTESDSFDVLLLYHLKLINMNNIKAYNSPSSLKCNLLPASPH